MTTELIEHKIALAHSVDPFTHAERRKVRTLLHRLWWLQHLDDNDRSSDGTEQERAALLWALTDLGVICGFVLERRRSAADLRCVRPPEHGGVCDAQLSRS